MTMPTPSPMFGDVTLTRYAAGDFDGTTGLWADGATTASTIRASVQPAKGNELLRLPEALRTKGVVEVISPSELKTANEDDKTGADEITWNGEQWVVQLVDDFSTHQSGDLAHYEALAVRKDR